MSAMSMQISKYLIGAIATLTIVSCGKNDPQGPVKEVEQAGQSSVNDGKIECAVNGATEFTRTCQKERISSDEGQIELIRHPDGGFRRFIVLKDGRGLSAADGAEGVKVSTVSADLIEVESGGDRYRLLAKVISGPVPDRTASPDEKGLAKPISGPTDKASAPEVINKGS
jgi:hypothetical protein